MALAFWYSVDARTWSVTNAATNVSRAIYTRSSSIEHTLSSDFFGIELCQLSSYRLAKSILLLVEGQRSHAPRGEAFQRRRSDNVLRKEDTTPTNLQRHVVTLLVNLHLAWDAARGIHPEQLCWRDKTRTSRAESGNDFRG
jgi:hypothetical protein